MNEEAEIKENSELSAVVGALLDMLDDKDDHVKQSVIESIRTISRQNPGLVIHVAVYFWELHRKISLTHMISLLKVMTDTCRHENLSLDTDLASLVAELAVNELLGNVAEKEASELLIALSRKYCTQAMGSLLTKLEPGVLPHYMVARTIGAIAASNPDGMLCFLKIALTIMLPMLTQIKDDNLKKAFCLTFGNFFDAVNEHIINTKEEPKQEITKDTYREEICSVFDVLTSNWLKQLRDNSLAEAALTALIPMIPLLPEDIENERIVQLIPLLLNFCKKPATRLSAVSVLSVLLKQVTRDTKELRPFLEQMHQTLCELINVSPFEASRDVALTHYEALQCFQLLVILYPEEGLDRILQQLKSPLTLYKSRALVVLRHLINTLPPEDDTTLQRIALNLQDCLGESGSRQMVGAIVALAAHPLLPLLPSQRSLFVHYMVSHCYGKNTETEAYSEALYLLATTVYGAESWLWPCLIRSLLDAACIESAPFVLRALSPLALKIVHNGDTTLERDFPRTKVLSRCLELLSDTRFRFAVITFLKSAASLFSQHLKPYWDEKLTELICFIHDEESVNMCTPAMQYINWEMKIVEFLEESVKIEGETWRLELADELAMKATIPSMMPLLASICTNNAHITLLVQLARSHGTCDDFARAVGICAKRHLSVVLKLIEESCMLEDTRKIPVRLLGLVKDTKAAATAETAKAGLLRSYAEIAQRGESDKLYSSIENHIAPWIIRQLNDCKELTTKDAGLIALEQVANAVHPDRLPKSTGLQTKASALATLLGMLQSSSGYRPLQLYPSLLRTAIALIRIPPTLNSEERDVFLGTILDKVISASSEIFLLQRDTMQQVVDELGILCSEIVSDSADALAEFVDILLPWMQSKTTMERKTTLQVLRTTLTSYNNSIKYTFPGGKLIAGQLIGRVISWSSDSEIELRSLIIDCVSLSVNIAARHRSISLDDGFEEELRNIKSVMNDNPNTLYDGIKSLATAVSSRIPSGEIISLAEGLIEGLLYRGEAGLAAGVALAQHFNIKGSEISRTDIYLVDNIIAQMRQMENASCRRSAACAIKSLMRHHPEEVIERLLSQPLPLDRGCEEYWKICGVSDELGSRAVELLLVRLENNNLFNENIAGSQTGKKNTAYFSSLAAFAALKYVLQTARAEVLIHKHLADLLSILLKYLSGWLHVDAPASVISTKFGYVPNREACKINPYTEVYFLLVYVLEIVDSTIASNLLKGTVHASEIQVDECVISTVRATIRSVTTKHHVLSNIAQSLGRLINSTVPMQRAVAVTVYAELIGKVNCGSIWLDAIINTLHEAKSDFSPLVRKLATIGLARIAYLEPKQIDEYFENCMDALLNGLEEPATGQGGNEVILESLRGLSVLMSVQCPRPISPRVVLALKPFIEKENWEMRLAAISALGAVAANWQKSVSSPDDDVTDHLLGCMPCLVIRLEDPNVTVAKTTQETLCKLANLLQSGTLYHVISTHLGPQAEFNFEVFLCNLINCLRQELPQRADELRNAVSRGYTKSECCSTRATAALILGIFGSPRSEDVQRLLQLLRDKESNVRIQAVRALSFCFTD